MSTIAPYDDPAVAAAIDVCRNAAFRSENPEDMLRNLTTAQKNRALFEVAQDHTLRGYVETLVEAGADPNCADPEDSESTPLHLAIRVDSGPEMLQRLIDFGAVAVGDDEGTTPLHMCATSEDEVKILLKHFPLLVNQRDTYNLAPIFNSNHETFPLFAAAGANLAICHPETARSLLWYAPEGWAGAIIMSGVTTPDPDILLETYRLSYADLVVLIRAGADLNPRLRATECEFYPGSTEGDTPLHLLMRSNCIQGELLKIQLLLREGASPIIANKNGNTPLQLSTNAGEFHAGDLIESFCKMLEAPDRFLNALDDKGKALVHKAGSATIKALARLGADLNIQDADGNTALHLAVKNHTKQLVEFLLTSGAYTDTGNNQGQTPLALAKQLVADDEVHEFYRVTVEDILGLLETTSNPSIEGKAAAKKK